MIAAIVSTFLVIVAICCLLIGILGAPFDIARLVKRIATRRTPLPPDRGFPKQPRDPYR